jgi:hypothetical protein
LREKDSPTMRQEQHGQEDFRATPLIFRATLIPGTNTPPLREKHSPDMRQEQHGQEDFRAAPLIFRATVTPRSKHAGIA